MSNPPPFAALADPTRRTLFERLLDGWSRQGYKLTSTRETFAGLDLTRLPRHEVVRGEVPGRSGTLMMQGEQFLSNWKIIE